MSHKKSSGQSPSLQTRADTGRVGPSSSLTSSRNTNASSSSKDNSPKDTSRSTLGTPPKGNSPKELHRNTSGGSLPGQQPAYSRSDSQTSTTSTSSVQTLRANSSSGSLQNAPVRNNSASGRVPCIPVSVNRPEIELMSPISPTGTSLKAARPPVVGPEVVSGCGQHCLTDLLSSVKIVKRKVKIWGGGDTTALILPIYSHLSENRPRCNAKSAIVQDGFWPIPGLSCAGVTGSV